MEGKNIYKNSYEELIRLKKEISKSDNVNINFSKMDTNTQSEIKEAIRKVINKRSSEILLVITGIGGG